MEILKDRRVQLILGAVLFLLAGLALAIGIALRSGPDDGPPPASQGGLVVESGHDQVQALDPAKPLKCYVGGRLAGEMTVAECAKKNGVATGALDVGVASSGGLAAAAAPANVTLPPPPPPPDAGLQAGQDVASDDQSQAGPGGKPCWSRAGGGWSRQGGAVSLSSCVQSLFAGQCAAPGSASYGRWGDKALRLVLGKVEVSDDGRNFRTLAIQTGDCAIPDLG